MLLVLTCLLSCEPFGPGDTGDDGGPPPTEGRLQLDTESIDFGEVSVILEGEKSRTFGVRNVGESLLVVAGLDRILGDDAAFETNAPVLLELKGGEAQDFQVWFRPLSDASYEGSLAPNSMETLVLSGTGLAPLATLDPTELDFGSIPVGCEAERTIQLSNAGSEVLTVTGATLGTTSDFQLLDTPSSSLEPSGSEELRVRFQPTQGGQLQTVLQIDTNDPATPAHVSTLAGQAYEGAQVEEDFVYTPDAYGIAVFSLTETPVPATIALSAGGSEISGWTYSPTANQVEIDGASQGLIAGENIEVSYLMAVTCPD